MSIHRFVVGSKNNDPRSNGTVKSARGLGFNDLRRITCHGLYFIEGQLSQEDLQRLALKLLTDPVTRSATWDELPASPPDLGPGEALVEVALRPGITGPVFAEGNPFPKSAL